jgi:hypothetical protein
MLSTPRLDDVLRFCEFCFVLAIFHSFLSDFIFFVCQLLHDSGYGFFFQFCRSPISSNRIKDSNLKLH